MCGYSCTVVKGSQERWRINVFEVWVFEKDSSTMTNSVLRAPDELRVSWKHFVLLHQTNDSVLVTSSSTAEAESLSASLVRQGKALNTVSTKHRAKSKMNRSLKEFYL